MGNCADIVIFGGTGDLSIRKLLPALYRCELEGKLVDDSRIFLSTRATGGYQCCIDKVEQGLHAHLKPGEFKPEHWNQFRQRLIPVTMDLANPNDEWDEMAAQLNEQHGRTRIFYMAIPPKMYGIACTNLAQKKLINEYSRVVLEKPIGYSLKSARKINEEVAQYFSENNIFRIDHYLGKETVQNLLALRFTNVIFEQLWNSKSIDHVQITLSETVGLEGRAGFYDQAGALRDMVQNHLLQLLCFIAMDPPNKIDATNIRNEKIKVMQALRPIEGAGVDAYTVRGQYIEGKSNDKTVSGYLTELGRDDSTTETFVAIRAHIDNWRWAGVPFYLRTGKRLKKRFSEIVIQFKPVSHAVFDKSAGHMAPNRLVIRLQPDECIKLTLMTKELHQSDMRLKPVALNLDFADTYDNFTSDAYKRLLLDVIDGNPTLFAHRDEVEQAWTWLDPILEAWSNNTTKPENYTAGSWGPLGADALLAREGREWFVF